MLKNYKTTPSDIINFWFYEIEPKKWFEKDIEFDSLIKKRFLSIHNDAICDGLKEWRIDALGYCAEIIILDQFSRNIYRGDKRSFMYDDKALKLSLQMIDKKLEYQLTPIQRNFIYLPLMHSESLEIHHKALELFSELNLPNSLEFEKQHYDIIKRFGRYPHRNKILNRKSTSEEIEFLKQKGSSF